MARAPDTSEEGLERLRAAVEANPRSTTFVALAHRLLDVGRAPEAEEICRKGLTQHPGLVTAQVALARALVESARTDEAQAVLIGAARGNTEHAEAFRVLAELVMKRGNRERARTLLEYAEELVPHDQKVARLLVEAGGTPTAKGARLQSDFEDTRVLKAENLAPVTAPPPPSLSPDPPAPPMPASPVPRAIAPGRSITMRIQRGPLTARTAGPSPSPLPFVIGGALALLILIAVIVLLKRP